MPDTGPETSAETTAWVNEPTGEPERVSALVGISRPIVPAAWRSEFLAERWIGSRACAVQPSTDATRLLVDVSFSPVGYTFSARYCYEDAEDALLALRDWDGRLDPPGQWVKEGATSQSAPGPQARPGLLEDVLQR